MEGEVEFHTFVGWIHRLRKQGSLLFIILRTHKEPHAYIQCVMKGKLAKTCSKNPGVYREATISLTGTLHDDARAPGGVELKVTDWELIGPSDEEIEGRIRPESGPEVMADNRHIQLRGTHMSNVVKLRAAILRGFRHHFEEEDVTEVSPPTIVQTQVEGGSTLFKLKYFDQEAYLTQSSQLYLETACPAVGDCFCVLPSFRAEKSRTRRHVSEFTHLEMEYAFIDFEGLLTRLEKMVKDVVKYVCEKKGDLLEEVNPGMVEKCKTLVEEPFIRMKYTEAIDWLKEHEVYKNEEEKIFYTYEDDIPEKPERFMVDTIGKPILLTHFPTHQKPFYMKTPADHPEVTESVDLLMPSVGEIIGGSMREGDYEKIMDGFKREGIKPDPYYWYTDLRKFGSFPHGGAGVGVDRFVCWLGGIDHIRDVILYPRNCNRCKP
ncbi:Asparagine--tRNA ligase, cytoplasmic [Aduncisulcus paluster]|uniref:asparagine--tRNA ligase n=1 Tax=Aduncisulcus paluster TaxID=2918883 RepID=A0ABQ5K5E1_9EUKA|nr:Asparagine--tRNA ligase, cytoplasmic [Aduncisulcus paluster]